MESLEAVLNDSDDRERLIENHHARVMLMIVKIRKMAMVIRKGEGNLGSSVQFPVVDHWTLMTLVMLKLMTQTMDQTMISMMMMMMEMRMEMRIVHSSNYREPMSRVLSDRT